MTIDVPVLEVRDVSKTYGSDENAVHAMKHASFAARKGELIALVGPSGSGKTTLLAMIGGLLTPSTGNLTIAGVDVRGLSDRQRVRFRREHIGFVFQGANLLPYLTARRNLLALAEISGTSRASSRETAERLLEEMGLTERANDYPSEMSGGERQRVAIARALMNDPDLLLLDEPTANLDTSRGRQVVEMLVSEVQQRNKTALMVTHDLRMAEYATRVLRVDDGVVTEVQK
jgi:putative ABC transport system ATP-binding protein